jgi:hypothetical protein
VDDDFETEIEELNPDELLLEDDDWGGRGDGGKADSLGLDAFDDDSEVKPVVLLSPKRKARDDKKPGDGNFMNDLERRLREDADS